MSGFLLSRQGAIAASDPTRPIPLGPYGEAVMALDPIAYYRFNEWLPVFDDDRWETIQIKDEAGNHSLIGVYDQGDSGIIAGSWGGEPPLVGDAGYSAYARYVSGNARSFDLNPGDNEFKPETHDGKLSACWWRKNDSSINGTIIFAPGWTIYNTSTSNSTQCRVRFAEDGDPGGVQTYASLTSDASVDTDDGQAHFYAVTLDYEGWARFYVDGILRTTGGSYELGAIPPPGIATSGTDTGFIFRDGFYDEIAVFGDVLTQPQIQDLYDLGAP